MKALSGTEFNIRTSIYEGFEDKNTLFFFHSVIVNFLASALGEVICHALHPVMTSRNITREQWARKLESKATHKAHCYHSYNRKGHKRRLFPHKQ